MRALTRMLALATALGLSGCESLFGPGDGPPEPLEELPRALSASERAVISASNHFAFGLLRGIPPPTSFSPPWAPQHVPLSLGSGKDVGLPAPLAWVLGL